MTIIDLSSKEEIDLEKCRERIAVIGFGSLEYHGGALPFTTDTLIVEAITKRCLGEINVEDDKCIILYPAIPYGFSHEWLRYPGTVSLSPTTLFNIIEDIVESIKQNIDPRVIVFVNGHGGNYSILEAYTRWKNTVDATVKYYIIDLWRIASRHGLKYCHACSPEAELLNKLYNTSYRGIQEKLEEPPQYGGYRPGQIGKLDASIEEFVEEICGEFKEIINFR